MPATLVIEAGLRGGFCALMLLLAWRLARGPRIAAARLGLCLAIGSAAYALQAPFGSATPVEPWQIPQRALMNGNPVVVWLLACAFFDDGFRLRAGHGAVWLGWVAMSLAGCCVPHGRWLSMLAVCGPLIFGGLALWQLLRHWRTDLVEQRIRWRRRVLVVVVGYSVLSTVLGVPWRGATGGTWLGLVDALALLAVGLAASSALLALQPAHWLQATVPDPQAPLMPPPTAGPVANDTAGAWPTPPVTVAPHADAPDLPPAMPVPTPPQGEPHSSPQASTALGVARPEPDALALARLQRAMDEGQLFRREGLTIGALATQIGLPEYRVRRAINQQLGFRNFNVYLNGHRIGWAKAALADPARAAQPVLALAIEAGFQSLGPFNRAFKDHTGLTPTEFRARALASQAPPPAG